MVAAGLHLAGRLRARPRRQDLGLDRGHKYETIREPYFFDYVQQQLIDKYGVNTVRNGGLKVFTTIDPAASGGGPAGRRLAAPSATREAGRPRRSPRWTPRTATSWRWPPPQPYSPTSQFNFAADAHRQPGSSFKPYVLAAALQQGMDPDTHLLLGLQPEDPDADRRDTTWTVNNAEDGEGGTMNVRQATIDSVNVDLRPARPRRRPRERPQDRLRHGDHHPPRRLPGRGHRRPAGSGSPRWSRPTRTRPSPTVASTTPRPRSARSYFPNGDTDDPEEGTQLEGVLGRDRLRGDRHPQGRDHLGDRGRLHRHRLPGGRQDGHHRGLQSDAWFVGYTPRISTAVWVGHPTSRDGSTGFGGTDRRRRSGTPTWSAAQGSYCGDFPQPQNPVEFSSSWSGSHTVSSPGSSVVVERPGRPPPPRRLRLLDRHRGLDHRIRQRQLPVPALRARRRPGARARAATSGGGGTGGSP